MHVFKCNWLHFKSQIYSVKPIAVDRSSFKKRKSLQDLVNYCLCGEMDLEMENRKGFSSYYLWEGKKKEAVQAGKKLSAAYGEEVLKFVW